MNVVIYARYSSDRQTEQSIEGQLKVCYEYIQRNGYTLVGEYIDRAISGTTDNRPEFLKMIEDSSKKHFEGVLVYQLDRFARNRYDSATYKAKLKKNGVKVLSARENISDDASGVLMEAVLEGMAEYYSVELSQKIKRGMTLNAEKCLCTGGGVALGYKIVDKHFVKDVYTAQIVERIFEMYVSGSTMADIINYLNDNDIKTSRGNEYNKNSIRRILTNNKYKGIYSYNDIEIPDGVPRIISDDLFDEVQNIMAKNKKAPARAKAIDECYILTTKLFCGHCKKPMTGISGTSKSLKKHQYYQCINNRRKLCKKKTVQKQFLEDLVIAETLKLLTPININKIAREAVDLAEKLRNSDTVKYYTKLLKDNEEATQNLIKALEAGRAVDVISAQIEKRQEEKNKLEVKIALYSNSSPKLDINKVRFFLAQFIKGDINNIEYRLSLIETFIDKIYLYDDKMTILYKLTDSHFDVPIDDILCSSNGRLVEARGVEPLSESLDIKASTGVECILYFPHISPTLGVYTW